MNRAPPDAATNRIAGIVAELGLVRPRITPLPGGLANRTLRLQDERHDLVLRLGASSETLGFSRDSEFAMLELAGAAGLAPEIVLARPEEGLIVTRHVAGRQPDAKDLSDPGFLARVGSWIARLQTLAPPPDLPPIDCGARAAGYLVALQERNPSALTAGIAQRLAVHRAAHTPVGRAVACHHDLHHRNFVDTGAALVVLDWEYAGPGDPVADLASCIGYRDVESAGIDALLAGYGEDSSAIRARLETQSWIFHCLWYGWNGVADLAGLSPDPDLQRRLVARLTS